MEFEHEKRDMMRLLEGIEMGTLPAADAYNVADKLDPLIVYFVFRYLRERYPASDPNSQGVTERLIEITRTYDDLVKKSQKSESDPVVEWFNDTYNMREWFDKKEDFVGLIVEKVEG